MEEVNNFVWTEKAIQDWIDIWAVLWSEVEICGWPFKWVWNHGDKYVFRAGDPIYLIRSIPTRHLPDADPIPLPEISTIREISYLMDHYGLMDILYKIQDWLLNHHYRSSMIQKELDLD
jgi:hypothetical protein